MILRAVLAVLLATALLGVALPALADARTTATTDGLDATATAIDRTAAALATDAAAVADPELAARTHVTVRIPTGLAAAPVERVALGDPTVLLDAEREANGDRDPDDDSGANESATHPTSREAAVVYRLRDGPTRVVTLDAAPVPVVPAGDGPVELRPAGETRLQLRLVRVNDGDPTVCVSRVG